MELVSRISYCVWSQVLCIEHTTAGLERELPVSLGFLHPGVVGRPPMATVLDRDDILARLGHPDDRLRGVSLRLHPAAAAAAAAKEGHAAGHGSEEEVVMELYTWSEEEYEKLVRD